jgi:hypothetical protein
MPCDAAAGAAEQAGDEDAVKKLDAFPLKRAPQQPGEFEAAALRIHDAGQIEAAGRAAPVAAIVSAGEFHANCLEILEPRIGRGEHFPHQHLIGNAIIARDDLAQDTVEIIIRKNYDLPGVGKRSMAGAADQPRIDKRDPCTGRCVSLGAKRGKQAAGAAADDENIAIDEDAVEIGYRHHHGRGLFFTEGCTSTIPSGQKISQLKQVMQCSRNLIIGRSLFCLRPGTSVATGSRSMWITSAGQTRSQMPQPVHFSISIFSIISL